MMKGLILVVFLLFITGIVKADFVEVDKLYIETEKMTTLIFKEILLEVRGIRN